MPEKTPNDEIIDELKNGFSKPYISYKDIQQKKDIVSTATLRNRFDDLETAINKAGYGIASYNNKEYLIHIIKQNEEKLEKSLRNGFYSKREFQEVMTSIFDVRVTKKLLPIINEHCNNIYIRHSTNQYYVDNKTKEIFDRFSDVYETEDHVETHRKLVGKGYSPASIAASYDYFVLNNKRDKEDVKTQKQLAEEFDVSPMTIRQRKEDIKQFSEDLYEPINPLLAG